MKKVFSIFLSCVFTAALGAGEFAVPASAATAEAVMDSSDSGFLTDAINEYLEGGSEDSGSTGELTMSIDDAEMFTAPIPQRPDVLINNNDGAYRYGDFLDANNKKVYDKFAELIAPSAGDDGIGTIAVALDTPVTIDVSGSSFSAMTEDETNEFWDQIWKNCKPGMDSAFLDIPELFWLDPAKITAGTSSAGVKFSRRSLWEQRQGSSAYALTINRIYINYNCYEVFGAISGDGVTQEQINSALDNINSYREQLEQAVERMLPDQGTRYDKIKQIHDAIAYNTSYDNSLSSEFMSTPIGALVSPPVVCEGYAEAFKLLCDRLDIPCVCVFGNYDSQTNAGHMWNYVQMEDGKWYSVDVTWDDCDGTYNIEVYYTYFLKGSKYNGDHNPNPDYGITYLEYPELSENDFDPASYYESTTVAETTTTTESETTTEATTTESETTTEATTTESETTTEATTTESETTTEATTTESETTTEATTTESETATEATTTESETTTEATTTESETTTEATTTESETTTEATTTESETTTEATTTESETTTEVTTTEPEYMDGDVNHDGDVSIADVISCIRVVLGRDPANKAACDLTGDGRVNVFDVILIKRLVFLPR